MCYNTNMPIWRRPQLSQVEEPDVVPGLWKLIRDSDYVKNIRAADKARAVETYKADIVRKAQKTRRKNKKK